jgi:SAM-dependent methyltransferase
MPASPSTTPERIKHANLRYHDAAAGGYDRKWAIDFGPVGKEQVGAKLAKALGGWPESPFGEALEIGSGTGYFSLNLLQLGLVGRLVATDISPGMLRELAATAERLGLEVETQATDAERLPFEDESFDAVVATLVFCTVDDPEAVVSEVNRVLKRDGRLLVVEHVRGEHPGRLPRWQDRFERPWGWFAGGCHPNRDTVATLSARFDVAGLQRDEFPGHVPPLVKPLVRGTASPSHPS